MKFGLSTLTRGLLTTREAYQAIAKAAERAGFDFLSVSDHIVVPADLKSAYPYAPGGAFGAAEHGHCLEQLATIAFLAGVTERLRLLTSVLVVPHRPPILAAKLLATIDVLSHGRLIVGAGAGWMQEEFALLEVPFAARGSLTDEYLEAFRELWTKDRPAYHGKHVRFAEVLFYPKPLQKPHPPIWIGGESPAAPSSSAMPGIPVTITSDAPSTHRRVLPPQSRLCGPNASGPGEIPPGLASRCLCKTHLNGVRTRPRTAMPGGCLPGLRPKWPRTRVGCRRSGSAMLPLGSGANRSRRRWPASSASAPR
jgi:probable F420-dependent oxidoreductase